MKEREENSTRKKERGILIKQVSIADILLQAFTRLKIRGGGGERVAESLQMRMQSCAPHVSLSYPFVISAAVLGIRKSSKLVSPICRPSV